MRAAPAAGDTDTIERMPAEWEAFTAGVREGEFDLS
jgi:hypothetical protein